MLLQYLGILGLGMLWGWLVGMRWHPNPSWRFRLSVLGASFSVGGVVFAYSSWTGVAFFFGAAFLIFLLHLAWREELRRRLV